MSTSAHVREDDSQDNIQSPRQGVQRAMETPGDLVPRPASACRRKEVAQLRSEVLRLEEYARAMNGLASTTTGTILTAISV